MALRLKPDPMGERRNPFQVYLIILATVVGIPSMIGHPPAGAVTHALNSPYMNIWGAMIFIGGACTLAGMYWVWDARDGLSFKRFGLVTLAIANGLFAVFILKIAGYGGIYSASVMLGFAYVCGARAHAAQQHINNIIQMSQGQGGPPDGKSPS